MDEARRVYEDEVLRVSHPPQWRVVTKMSGCRLMLLSPVTASDFRPSFAITDEPQPEADLDEIVAGLLPTFDRYFTDYTTSDLQDVTVASLPAKLVRGAYRQGRVRVALDQWVIPTEQRLVALSASYDSEQDADFFDLASRVVSSLEFL